MDEHKKEELFEVSRHLKRAENGLKNADITERNKAVIERFKTYLISRGISTMRVRKYIISCKTLAETHGKDFEDYKKEDCDYVMSKLRERVINQAEIQAALIRQKEDEIDGIIRKTKEIKPRKYKQNSLNDFIGILKMLFKFLDGVTGKNQSPRTAHLVKKTVQNRLTEEDLVTEEEVNRLIASASSLQFKTVLSILFESAARPSEVRGIQLKDITRIEHGYKITIDGKTGQRAIFSITSAPILTQCLNAHAFREPNMPLFFKLKNGKPTYCTEGSWRKKIHGLSRKVLGRAIPLYRLRHSRATILIQKGMHTSRVKALLGHARGSNVLEQTYLHMSDTDLKNSYYDAAGIEIPAEKRKKSVFVLKKCRCGTDLSAHQLICEKCGAMADPTIKAINEEQSRFSFSSLNDEERSFMREEMKRVMAELIASQKN